MTERTRDDLYGIEFDWFAVDRDGHPALFSSAGYGPIPEVAMRACDEQHRLLDWLKQAGPGSRQTRELDGCGEELSVYASHGFYCYDWKHWEGPYLLLARPEAPALMRDLRPEIAEIVRKVRFTGLCFVKESAIRPEEHLR